MTRSTFRARRWRESLLVALAGATLLPGAAAGASPISKPYVLGTEPVVSATVMWASRIDLGVVCAQGDDLPGIGGACFDVTDDASTATVLIEDVSGRRVSGWISFLGAAGRELAVTSFCHGASVAVPPGAVRAKVAVDAAAIGCGLHDGAVGTTGRITVDLHP